VIGSENPWAEAILLAEGAEQVTTLEYGYINSTHPKLKGVFLPRIKMEVGLILLAILPKDFDQQFLDGTLPQYDGAVSFSSFEHAGVWGFFGLFVCIYVCLFIILFCLFVCVCMSVCLFVRMFVRLGFG
jgi:hypothetical protein